ncbi:MerR family transcriptional regulator [Yinghuangia soli]|uniref:MerR family transcriptional regulator n=1 Tax=Yinghuangia soli TaxID=2908204 RepID=A0AA41Q902_9ACTN|nr:MerR family transcriptional regulator [Yinghuangia soli]MCF2533120.1 MerR family transcriptional regulator [Yinghuangia soli]
MRIGDAAAAAGTTPRALRFYEQRGLLPAPPRSPSGQRVYGPGDVARIRAVRELLQHGLTVEDVRGFASRLDLLAAGAPPHCTAVVEDLAEPPAAPPHTGTPSPTPPSSPASPAAEAVDRRLAALDAEIARLTHLRTRLAQAAGRPAAPAASPTPAD